MNYITGFDRSQTTVFPLAIDQLIEHNNPVRFIDAFVDSLPITNFGFKDVKQNVNGRPPYHLTDLLKLYIYGYMNKTRSSKDLEKECN